MEKNRLEILSGIKESLESLKEQLAALEARIAEIEAEEDIREEEDLPEDEVDLSPIDINLDEDMGITVDFPAHITPIEADAVPSPETEPEQEAPSPEPEPEPVAKPDANDGNLSFGAEFNAAPPVSINDKQEKKSKKAVMDVLGTKCAWKTAMPGTPVKNIISAISLNDRVLFINTLFKENATAFQNAIAALNGMSSFNEAEEYIRTNYPEWNLNSDIVYRLMMAIRRKLR